MGDAHPKHDGRVDAFLPSLVSAVRKVNDEGAEITTASFTALMDQVVRVFDHLGTVLHFAKHDMVVKNDSLKAVAHRLKYLQQVGPLRWARSCIPMLSRACVLVPWGEPRQNMQLSAQLDALSAFRILHDLAVHLRWLRRTGEQGKQLSRTAGHATSIVCYVSSLSCVSSLRISPRAPTSQPTMQQVQLTSMWV
jgi:hypothetical protein